MLFEKAPSPETGEGARRDGLVTPLDRTLRFELAQVMAIVFMGFIHLVNARMLSLLNHSPGDGRRVRSRDKSKGSHASPCAAYAL